MVKAKNIYKHLQDITYKPIKVYKLLTFRENEVEK